jgi:uncharacterized protein
VKEVLEKIIELRKEGMSFRKIAKELNSTVGKVQYQWVKHQKQISIEPVKQKEEMKPPAPKKRSGVLKAKVRGIRREISPKTEIQQLFTSPTRLFIYWKVPEPIIKMVLEQFQINRNEIRYFLRLYDVTSIEFNGHNHHSTFEMMVPENANNWFINGLKSNRSYCTEYGIILPNGKFFSICRSNVLHTPRIEDEVEYHSMGALADFESGQVEKPQWVEHVSTYSYYVRN